MPRTEVLTTLRIVALNLHVRIAEANLDDVAAVVLNVDSTLFPFAGSVEWLVERHLLALVCVTFFGEGGFHCGTSSRFSINLSRSIPRILGHNLSILSI